MFTDKNTLKWSAQLFLQKKRIKLGFYKGVDLPDPENLLEGTGKISRYVQIKSEEQISSSAIQTLLEKALEAYKQRIAISK
jgi:hypothetical protein